MDLVWWYVHHCVWSRFFVPVIVKKLWRHKSYKKWRNKLDSTQRKKIDVYVKRVARGESQNSVKKLLDDDIREIKVGGWRVYFAESDGTLFLLNGGDKDTKGGQSRDIEAATNRWRKLCESKEIGDLLTKS